MMKIFKGLSKIFGLDGVTETALKIIDKVAGTDWTPKEKAQFVLDYADKTKYQSPTRRFIALTMFAMWSLMVLVWLISTIMGNTIGLEGALSLAADVTKFMDSNINVGISGILAFYFLIGMKK